MNFNYSRQVFAFECDFYGHLNNANYLHLFEEARAQALKDVGLSILKISKLGFSIFVKELKISYLKPIMLEDIFLIKSEIITINRVKSLWEQTILTGDKKCAKIELQAVFAKDGKPFRVDKNIIEKIKGKSHEYKK